MPGKVNPDGRRVAAPQAFDEIVDLAHLVHHHAEMLVQCADDRIALPLVVEPAPFGRRDVDEEAHRRCGLG
jgi:hypothetical protein